MTDGDVISFDHMSDEGYEGKVGKYLHGKRFRGKDARGRFVVGYSKKCRTCELWFDPDRGHMCLEGFLPPVAHYTLATKCRQVAAGIIREGVHDHRIIADLLERAALALTHDGEALRKTKPLELGA